MRTAVVMIVAVLSAAPQAVRASEVAEQLQATFIEVAEEVSDSVAFLEVKSQMAGHRGAAIPFLDSTPGGFQPLVIGSGSGVILDEAGHVLTNYHVVEGAVDIQVRLHDNRTFPGTLVGADPDSDLAVVHIEADGLHPASFAPSDDVHIGQWAIAIGAPFGLRYSLTVGHVSARSRRAIGDLPIQDFLQTDASINPGNSGGPLVDIDGRVIGINTMIIGLGTGIGLAIPSDIAVQVSKVLIEEGRVLRGDAGMTFQDGEPELLVRLGAPQGTTGVVVAMVEPGGPAEVAGLVRGDVVTACGGEATGDAAQLLDRILAGRPGDAMKCEWLQEGAPKKGAITLAERFALPTHVGEEVEHTGDDIGVAVKALSNDMRRKFGIGADAPGLLVTQVRVGSPAHRAGLLFGDLIVEVEDDEVRFSMDMARAILAAEGDHVVLYVFRFAEQTSRYVLVEKP